MIWPTLAAAATDGSWLTTVIGWFHDPESLLLAMGPWVLWGTLAIVLVESGILFPVLPGDSLLFTAGLLHDRLGLHLPTLVTMVFIAAFIGAQIGYWIGAKWGRRLFKPDARFLKTEHLEKAEHYFEKYGGRSLIIGRFIPFVRTFIPLAAGIARYSYPKFLLFNSLGSLLWGAGITWLGSVLGDVQFVHDNLSVIIIAIVFVSLVPMIVEVVLQRRKAAKQGAGGEQSASAVDSVAAGAVDEVAEPFDIAESVAVGAVAAEAVPEVGASEVAARAAEGE